MGSDEEGTLARLKGLRRDLVDPTIAAHRGRIVKTTGDGLLVEFSSAVDAARCAAEVQRAIVSTNSQTTPDERIDFRIGIHVGDIIFDENDIFGDGVNIAARLEGIAEPGGICISDDAQRQVRGKIDITFQDMGVQTLKNIAEPIRAWRVELNGAPSPAVLPASKLPLTLPDKPSIAVLPFQNMSGDPEQEYFADGIVEDIITALSRFKSLFVIARNSTFTYKGKTVDIKQVGRELGVQYVLEGSVRKLGEKVRITVQLIDASSGNHVWAERFDGTLQDIFDMQDNVTTRVASVIAPKLEQVRAEQLTRKPSENWSSYECYLRGMSQFHVRQLPQTLEALKLFRRAVELDPGFGRGYARIANTIQTLRDVFGQSITAEEHSEAARCAETAIQLSDEDEVVLSSVVFVIGNMQGDYNRGAQLADRALALNGNYSLAWNARGTISILLGECEQALSAFETVIRLNPLDKVAVPYACFGAGGACLLLGRIDEAAVWSNKMLALLPNDIRGLFILAGSKYLTGHTNEGDVVSEAIKQHYPHMRSSHLRQAYRVQRPEHMALVERVIKAIGLAD